MAEKAKKQTATADLDDELDNTEQNVKTKADLQCVSTAGGASSSNMPGTNSQGNPSQDTTFQVTNLQLTTQTPYGFEVIRSTAKDGTQLCHLRIPPDGRMYSPDCLPLGHPLRALLSHDPGTLSAGSSSAASTIPRQSGDITTGRIVTLNHGTQVLGNAPTDPSDAATHAGVTSATRTRHSFLGPWKYAPYKNFSSTNHPTITHDSSMSPSPTTNKSFTTDAAGYAKVSDVPFVPSDDEDEPTTPPRGTKRKDAPTNTPSTPKKSRKEGGGLASPVCPPTPRKKRATRATANSDGIEPLNIKGKGTDEAAGDTALDSGMEARGSFSQPTVAGPSTLPVPKMGWFGPFDRKGKGKATEEDLKD